MFLHPQNYFLGKQLIRDQEKMRSIHINQKLEKLEEKYYVIEKQGKITEKFDNSN
jgi:hypothetical protein